jgi:hypothetical protein
MSPDASCCPAIDLAFDAEQLRSKYDGLALLNQWGEHPNHPMDLWQTEVYCKNTRSVSASTLEPLHVVGIELCGRRAAGKGR